MFFRYSHRHSTPPPNWGTWRESRVDTWAAQLKIITTPTVQVDQQKTVVELQDAVVETNNDKVDAAYEARDEAQAVLEQADAAINAAAAERDQMQAALQDEENYLVTLQSDLALHTQRLRNTEP